MCINSTAIVTSLRFAPAEQIPAQSCSTPTTSQIIAGASEELHALPVQLEVLRVVATLENVGNATVPETAAEDRIMRIQLQEQAVHLVTAFIAVRPSASLNLCATGRRRESTEGKKWQ